MPHALLVEDQPETLEALAELVKAEGFTVSTAGSLDRARAELGRNRPDVVLADLKLPDGSAMALLDATEPLAPPAVVLITGHASVDTAIEALRRGATDYLTKPLDARRLREILADIAHTGQLTAEIGELTAQLDRTGRFGTLVGRSEAMRRVFDLIGRIAPTSAGILIVGESGSGKDVVARAIHDLSRRRLGPYVPVNCGALSPTLMESELFGHERGSFTGADRRHKGYFERATRGTLFLDEVTEMPIGLQVKLLRVLETGTFHRVGGEDPLSVDVRILAATNRPVQEAVEQGRLREDLYYRLNVVQLAIPPLRERREDIELLAQAFLDELERTEGRRKRLTDAALQVMRGYSWPGNVRELRNVVHSAHILSGDAIGSDNLAPELTDAQPSAPGESGDVIQVTVGTPIASVERRLIMATLRQCGGNKTKAADLLGISLKTLYNRLNAYHAESSLESAAPDTRPTSPD
jgi:DNA-binding NtrC family response regulator